MPKATKLATPDVAGNDPEEIHVAAPPVMPKESVTMEEVGLLDELKGVRQILADQQKEIARLRAIADTQKAASYDWKNREKFFVGHLRYLESPEDPIISWKTTKNVSTIDQKTDLPYYDQRLRVKTLSGKELEMDIHDWNDLAGKQVKFKFLRMDHGNNECDIQLSTDDGTTFTGLVLKDVGLSFVNP